MIVVTTQVWPRGSQADSREILSATISNARADDEKGDAYFAHVVTRPYEDLGISGYASDVEVVGHHRRLGVEPLVMSVLNAAYARDEATGVILPGSRLLSRQWLQQAFEYEQVLRGR